jgi:hypothetical protein
MGARSSELSSKLRWEATVRMHVLRTYGRDKCAGEIVHVVAAGSAPFVGWRIAVPSLSRTRSSTAMQCTPIGWALDCCTTTYLLVTMDDRTRSLREQKNRSITGLWAVHILDGEGGPVLVRAVNLKF